MAKTTNQTTAGHVKRAYVNEEVQRDGYGGFNFGAAFFGWLVASALGSMLTALVSAVGIATALSKLQNNTGDIAGSADTIGILGGILLLIVLGVAYYGGGYVAGRMSRFDGARQGLGVWIMGVVVVILLAIAGALFGAKYNLVQQIQLPAIPVDAGDLTAVGLITLVATAAVTLFAAIAGGKVGERYHHKVSTAGVEDRSI